MNHTDPPAPIDFDLLLASCTPLTPPDVFLQSAASLGIAFGPNDLDQLGVYLACLLKANAATNLTAIRDPDQAWERHILDALSLMPVLAELESGSRIADIGSGGGLPTLPLAITMPELNFTCIEATGKKVEFLRAVGRRLGLGNLEVLGLRAEDAGQNRGQRQPDGSRLGAMRESFDAVTARAVGHLAVIAELTIPLARVGSLVILIKGQKADEELKQAKEALHLLGARCAGVLETPTGKLVILEKQRVTPRIYPRRNGEPKRVPLGRPKGGWA